MINEETDIEKYKDYLIVVEGKKDKKVMAELGFANLFVINKTGKSLNEQIEEIEKQAGKKKICILTDFDKRGKALYLRLKAELAQRRVRLDNSLRGILHNNHISHIEGLKVESIQTR